MGIDALDLAFRLEKRFGITISRDEGIAVLFDTPGTIHRYLVAKLAGEYQRTPKIEPLLVQVSGAVNRISGRWKLTSQWDLNKRFAPATRPANWRALEQALGISLPPLESSGDEAPPKVPRKCESLISLTNWIVEHYPERVEWLPVGCERTGKMGSHHWTKEEIWDILCDCICDALGVKPKEVTPDARMIEDLGIG